MTKSDDAHTRPKNPLPPVPKLPPLRSKQATLVMGGNVNEAVGALPPPPTVPTHLTEGHPSHPNGLSPAAPGMRTSVPLPPLPPPPVVPTSTRLPIGGLPAPTPVPLPRGPMPRASSSHVAETKTMPPTSLSRASLRAGVAPRRGGNATTEWLAAQFVRTKTAGVASAEWARTRVERTKEQARDAKAWLDSDKRRWLLPAGIGVLLFGGVGYCSGGSESPLGANVPAISDNGRERKAGPIGAQDVPQSDEAMSPPLSEPAGKPGPAKQKPSPGAAAPPVARALSVSDLNKPSIGDPGFAVRERISRTSCDEALGKPFVVNSQPNIGEAGALWNRSRKSLMLGNKERALKEMCESASLDVEGRGTYGLSEFYLRESDFEQALTWAKRVPSGSRRFVDAQAMIGDIHGQMGDVEAARAAYLKGWNMASDDTRVLERTAANFALSAHRALRKNDWWTAENFFRRALVLNDEDAMAALGLARVFLRFELNEAAILWAEHALEVGADADEALLAMCEAFYANKDKAGAQKALDRLKKIAPSDPNLAVWETRIQAL